MAEPIPLLSAVVPSWNTRDLLDRCLRSLERSLEGISSEILVVDDGSTDGTQERVREEFPATRLLVSPRNEGYAAATNRGIREARGETVLLLGSDTAVHPDAPGLLLEHLRALPEGYAAVAPRLLHEDGSTQPSCRELPTPLLLLLDMTRLWRLFPRSPFGLYRMTAFDHATERDVVQPQATCLLVRRRVFDAIGLLDADRYPVYFNDVDWCARLQGEGKLIRFLPTARVTHGYGLTTRKLARRRRLWRESLLRYLALRHGGATKAPGRLLVRMLTLPWVWADRSPAS